MERPFIKFKALCALMEQHGFHSSESFQRSAIVFNPISLEQMQPFAAIFAKWLKDELAVCEKIHLALCAELAGGKTTFVRKLARAFNLAQAEEIESPTYSFHHDYPQSLFCTQQRKLGFFHYDFYRLHDEHLAYEMGLDQNLLYPGLHCIEWANRLSNIIPQNAIWAYIRHYETDMRIWALSTQFLPNWHEIFEKIQ